jgi:hypothetical protein
LEVNQNKRKQKEKKRVNKTEGKKECRKSTLKSERRKGCCQQTNPLSQSSQLKSKRKKDKEKTAWLAVFFQPTACKH